MREPELDAMLLNPALEQKVDCTIKRLKALDEVAKKLQWADATVLTARAFPTQCWKTNIPSVTVWHTMIVLCMTHSSSREF